MITRNSNWSSDWQLRKDESGQTDGLPLIQTNEADWSTVGSSAALQHITLHNVGVQLIVDQENSSAAFFCPVVSESVEISRLKGDQDINCDWTVVVAANAVAPSSEC